MRISDWSSDVCSSDLPSAPIDARLNSPIGPKRIFARRVGLNRNHRAVNGVNLHKYCQFGGIPQANRHLILTACLPFLARAKRVNIMVESAFSPPPESPRGDRKRVVWGKRV